jgi:hypothetical protein
MKMSIFDCCTCGGIGAGLAHGGYSWWVVAIGIASYTLIAFVVNTVAEKRREPTA